MASVVRISDELYTLTDTVARGLNRSLTQQLELWARLGAALDAAGITMEQTLRLLGADASAKEEAVRLAQPTAQAKPVASARAGRAAPPTIESVRERDAQVEREVASGQRPAETLFLFTRQRAQAARATFPAASRRASGW